MWPLSKWFRSQPPVLPNLPLGYGTFWYIFSKKSLPFYWNYHKDMRKTCFWPLIPTISQVTISPNLIQAFFRWFGTLHNFIKYHFLIVHTSGKCYLTGTSLNQHHIVSLMLSFLSHYLSNWLRIGHWLLKLGFISQKNTLRWLLSGTIWSRWGIQWY